MQIILKGNDLFENVHEMHVEMIHSTNSGISFAHAGQGTLGVDQTLEGIYVILTVKLDSQKNMSNSTDLIHNLNPHH